MPGQAQQLADARDRARFLADVDAEEDEPLGMTIADWRRLADDPAADPRDRLYAIWAIEYLEGE